MCAYVSFKSTSISFCISVGFPAICSRLCSTLLPSRMTTGQFCSACISMLTVTQRSGKLFEAWHQPRMCGISSCRCLSFAFSITVKLHCLWKLSGVIDDRFIETTVDQTSLFKIMLSSGCSHECSVSQHST